MVTLELDDIQAIIATGYPQLPAACFGLLAVEDPAAARQWLTQIAGEITTASKKDGRLALNVSFTVSGLRKLGLDEKTLEGFLVEYQEGMTAGHRQRILGDTGLSEPTNWKWGGPGKEVDVMLMVYAPDTQTLESRYERLREDFEGKGFRVADTLPTQILEQQKEHFGFHDGISQPLFQA